MGRARTFLLQENATFGYNNWHVTVYEALAIIIRQGNCDIRILDANVEWNAEDTSGVFWSDNQSGY